MIGDPETNRQLTVSLPLSLNRTFDIIIFDWDGTVVPDRHADATEATQLIDALLRVGAFVVPLTGTNINNMYRQSLNALRGEHVSRLFACCNRGSEVFTLDRRTGEPQPVHRRMATPEEDEKLTRVAERIKAEIESETSLQIGIVYDRLNRRKVDVLTLPGWEDPPKARIAELEAVTQRLLKDAGYPRGMADLFDLARKLATEEGLEDARFTTDMKYLEVGLTDKGDSTRWVINELAQPRSISVDRLLFGGDEFGFLGGAPGSDFLMVVPEAEGGCFVSVGIEPNGVPAPIINLGGGPQHFLDVLRDQLKRRQEIG